MTTGRNRLMQIIAGQIKDFFEDMLGGTHKDSFDYQFNTIHDYSLMGGLDGLIINYGMDLNGEYNDIHLLK